MKTILIILCFFFLKTNSNANVCPPGPGGCGALPNPKIKGAIDARLQSISYSNSDKNFNLYTLEAYLYDIAALNTAMITVMSSAIDSFQTTLTSIPDPPPTSGMGLLGTILSALNLVVSLADPVFQVAYGVVTLAINMKSAAAGMQISNDGGVVSQVLALKSNLISMAYSSYQTGLMAQTQFNQMVAQGNIATLREWKRNTIISVAREWAIMPTYESLLKQFLVDYINSIGGFFQITYDVFTVSNYVTYRGWAIRIQNNQATEKSLHNAVLQIFEGCVDTTTWSIPQIIVLNVHQNDYCFNAEVPFLIGNNTPSIDCHVLNEDRSFGSGSVSNCAQQCGKNMVFKSCYTGRGTYYDTPYYIGGGGPTFFSPSGSTPLDKGPNIVLLTYWKEDLTVYANPPSFTKSKTFGSCTGCSSSTQLGNAVGKSTLEEVQ